MSCQTKFDDKLIDQFLSFCFCDHSIFKISFNINIKECRSTSKGSCSSIILLFPQDIPYKPPEQLLSHFLQVLKYQHHKMQPFLSF